MIGAVAQLGERLLCKQEVVGSIPIGSTILCSLSFGGQAIKWPKSHLIPRREVVQYGTDLRLSAAGSKASARQVEDIGITAVLFLAAGSNLS